MVEAGIELGRIDELDIETIIDPPIYDIYLGRRWRRPAGPPTTKALRDALASIDPNGEAI